MAQHDYILENQPGAAFRGDLNAAMQAIVSQNSGATEPAKTYPYQFWADTTSGILKQRNAINNGWINIFSLSTGAPSGGYAQLSGATFTGTVSVPSLNGGQLAGMRNKIINGNFKINQRAYVSGTNVSAANTYTLDRWRVVTSGQNITFTASGNGNLVTSPAGGIEQVIEGINIEGGTYVLNWTGSATATVNGTARAKGESFTLTANTNTTVRLSSGTVGLVQLEPGTVATPFEHRPIGLELALCQRYYLNAANTVIFGCASIANGAVFLSETTASVIFPVTMRAAPTVNFSAVEFVFSASAGNVTAHGFTAALIPSGSGFPRVNGFFANIEL